jgi:hypothetical protein
MVKTFFELIPQLGIHNLKMEPFNQITPSFLVILLISTIVTLAHMYSWQEELRTNNSTISDLKLMPKKVTK